MCHIVKLGTSVAAQRLLSTWNSVGFPDDSRIGQAIYNVGEKPTVISACILSSGERLIRGYTEFDFTVDEG